MASTPDITEAIRNALGAMETQYKTKFEQLASQVQQSLGRVAPMPTQSPVKSDNLSPIHQRFMEVYSNTKEGSELSQQYQNMFREWMVTSGNAARLQQEEMRLRGQFESQSPNAIALRRKIETGAIEYAHDLAVRLEKGGDGDVEGRHQ